MFPIGDDNRDRLHRPIVTYLLIALNVAVFLYMLTLQGRAQDVFVYKWGVIPARFTHPAAFQAANPAINSSLYLTLFTAMFIHGGWLHIGGNMLFLWVFGDNIEDRLGHVVYFLFYLLAGIVAAFIQGAIDPDSVVPVLGASGAVAGVLGAYLIWFPGATIRVVFPFFILIFIPLPVPAWIMIGVWFAQNLLAGYATIAEAAAPDQGVAWFAHIGGFVFGMVIAILAGRKPARGRY